jgi:amidohydrolase
LETKVNLDHELARHAEELTQWRRDLHRHPELSFNEHRTAAFVADRLREFGLEPQTGIGATGVVALVDSGQPGPCIAFRADMDALPMHEESGRDYASHNEGMAHACGHDGHTTALLGVARTLSRKLPATGRVLLIFQPAEETVAGAQAMIGDGLLQRHEVDEIYAFHNMPSVNSGAALVLTGPTLNGAVLWEIEVEGVGGHGAAFYATTDPLQAAARLAVEIPSIIGRYVDPSHAALITVGKLQAGSAANIIPGTATLAGTLRALSAEVMAGIYGRLEQLCRGVAEATGCIVVCRRLMSVPPCVNAPGPSDVAARACAQVLGPENVIRDLKPLSFTDDFAHFLGAVPGAYLFLGQDGPMCHNPGYDFDDALLPVAGSIFVAIVADRLGLSRTLQPD